MASFCLVLWAGYFRGGQESKRDWTQNLCPGGAETVKDELLYIASSAVLSGSHPVLPAQT